MAEVSEVPQPTTEAQEAMREPTLEDLAKEFVVDWQAVGIQEGQTVGPKSMNHLFGPSPTIRVSVDQGVSEKGMTPKEAVMKAINEVENHSYGGVTGGALEALSTLLVKKGEYHNDEFKDHPIVTMPEQDKIDVLMLASEFAKLKTMREMYGVGSAPWASRTQGNENRPTFQQQLDKIDNFQDGLKGLAGKGTPPAAPQAKVA